MTEKFTIHCTGVDRFIVHGIRHETREVSGRRPVKKKLFGLISYTSYQWGVEKETKRFIYLVRFPMKDMYGSYDETEFKSSDEAKAAIDQLLVRQKEDEERVRINREFIAAHPPEEYP